VKRTIVVSLLIAAVSALATDLVVERAPVLNTGFHDWHDATRILYWDNGRGSWLLAWPTGEGAWVGNDFDVSSLKTFSRIREIRIFTVYTWPNSVWDGFRVGVFAFDGGVPGSLLWPTSGNGLFFMPYGNTGWKNVTVDWVVSGGRRSFIAAMEQYYDQPNCDAYTVDNNPTFRGHSWRYYGGSWAPLEGTYGYRNLMLRVLVDNETVPVAPTSLGRVKALYY
jgi:hypothetical protein